MSLVLHLAKDNHVGNLVLAGERLRKRVTYEVVGEDGHTLLTIRPEAIAAYTHCKSMAEAHALKARLDARIRATRIEQGDALSQFRDALTNQWRARREELLMEMLS